MTADEEKQTPVHAEIRALPKQGAAPAPSAAASAVTVRDLSVFFGANRVLKGVSLDVQARAVTAIIGPSGCGKSTFLRALNRMHELSPAARVEGQIRLFGDDIYGHHMEPVLVRRR